MPFRSQTRGTIKCLSKQLARSLQGKLAPRLMTGEKRSLFRPFCQHGKQGMQGKQASTELAGKALFLSGHDRAPVPPRVQTQIARSFTLRVMDLRRQRRRGFLLLPMPARPPGRVPQMINISHERSLQLRYLPLPISLSNHRNRKLACFF